MFRSAWRAGVVACISLVPFAQGQVITFESNGLQYQTLTRGGLTVMYAHLPSRLREYAIMQVAISNGSNTAWVIHPEEFRYQRQDGTFIQAAPALDVVTSFLGHASRHDVIKLVSTYEAGIYGNSRLQSTNGYELRRQSALAEVSSAKLKAAAAASAIAFVKVRLDAGESTDGAVFFPNGGKSLGPGTLLLHAAAEDFQIPSNGASLTRP